MQFRILGTLDVVDEGETLPLGGGRPLALVALLLLNANEVVSTDRLVDELWQEQPPATAEKIVRNYVSLLRKQLGDRLVRQAPGYLLRVEPGELDSERFESLVREAREQEPAAAAATLRRALALWSGPPLAQIAYEPFAQRAIASLEELRLGALEDRIDADLQLGRDRELVPELEQLVREQPLRERRGLSSTAVAVGEAAVWVANTFVPGSVFKTSRKRGSVSRIDPETNVVVTTIPWGTSRLRSPPAAGPSGRESNGLGDHANRPAHEQGREDDPPRREARRACGRPRHGLCQRRLSPASPPSRLAPGTNGRSACGETYSPSAEATRL